MVSARPVILGLVACALAPLVAVPVAAQTPRMPPVFDQLASPFTDSEIGGIGCAVASGAIGAGMLGLMGGPAGLRAALVGVAITPRAVLEASAAGAFVFSSACYVGQAVAPVVMLGWTTLLDSLTAPRNAPTPTPRGGPGGAVSWMPGVTPAGDGQGSGAPLP